jgi:hypothetical protein
MGGEYYYATYSDDNDDGVSDWSRYDSYIEAALPAGEYYAVATNYNSADNGGTGDFYVEFYINEPAAPKLIVSTAADVEFVDAAGVSEIEARTALAAVNLTATDNANETFAINNNPFGWLQITYYGDVHAWQYVNFSIACYEFGTNYMGAAVAVRTTSGLDKIGLPNLNLYPNPAVERITLSGLNGGEQISIIDLNGKIAAMQQALSQETSINVSSLPQGAYLVAVKYNGKLGVVKFIKE